MNKHIHYRLKEKMSEIDDKTNKIKLIKINQCDKNRREN